LKPSDHADLEETLRALEILRERKASSDRFDRFIRTLTGGLVVLAILIGLPLALVVFSGIIQGEIGVWPVIIAVSYVGILYLAIRIMYPRNNTAVSYLSHHFGYRKSDSEILDEQIADYEERLETLRREGRD
jgi:uncharacterized membrane protein